MALAFNGKGGGGGGAPLTPLARNVGQAEFDFAQDVAAGTALHLTLAFSDGDATIVSLTDPLNPTIVAAGLYAFTLAAQDDSSTVSASLGLLVDDNYYSITAQTSKGPDPAGQYAGCVVWWCNSSDPFAAVAHTLGGADTSHIHGSVYVQRIR